MKKKKRKNPYKYLLFGDIEILVKTGRRLIPNAITDLFNTDMIVPTDPITFRQFLESYKK